MDNILCVENLNYSYHDKFNFTNLTFSIKQNSINAVIGPNNCGKTTLIKLLCGILQTQNSISVDSVVLNSNNMRNYSSIIGYNRIILNSRNMSMKVYDLLASLKIEGILKKDLLNRINYLLEFFDVSSFKQKRMRELSNIDRVKVYIISSLINSPKIIFLDDIFDCLTYSEASIIFAFIKKYLDLYSLSVLFTTNKLENILFSSYTIFINNGYVQLDGTPSKILEHDNVLAREGIYIPIMMDLSLKLKFYNLVDDVIMDTGRMVDELWK